MKPGLRPCTGRAPMLGWLFTFKAMTSDRLALIPSLIAIITSRAGA